MDLIELYHRLGISLARSKLSRSPAARRGYGRLARRYADAIEQQRINRSSAASNLLAAF